MNRYYEWVNGITNDEHGVTVEEGWKPESGSKIVDAQE